MIFLLKPKHLYQYISIHEREVLNVPNPYAWPTSDEWKWYGRGHINLAMLPRHVCWLAPKSVFMPIQSRLSDTHRWTKIFVGTEMGWIRINLNDSCVIFKELKDQHDVA